MRSLFCRALLFVFLFISMNAEAQLVSGPMLGPVELRTAKLWIEVKPGSDVVLQYWKKGDISSYKSIQKKTDRNAWFSPVIFNVVGLELNTTYEYQFHINQKAIAKPTKAIGSFTTKELWQWRKPAPDFSFLTGSCAYINEPAVDRPGKPYGGYSSIFESMAKEKSCIYALDG